MDYTYSYTSTSTTTQQPPFIYLGDAIVCKENISYLIVTGGNDARRTINIGLHDGTVLLTTMHGEQKLTEIVKELNGVNNVGQDGQQDD